MLRSTLLIRLVAAYEAYLTDALRELAERSSDFLKTDQRVDLSQAHLMSLAEDQEVEEFIVSKTLRSLSSGGFKETAKFYKKMSIDVGALVYHSQTSKKSMIGDISMYIAAEQRMTNIAANIRPWAR